MSDKHYMGDYSLSSEKMANIAEMLLLDEKTFRQYFGRYQKGGIRALLGDYYSGAESRLDEHQIKEQQAYLEGHIFPDAKSVTG